MVNSPANTHRPIRTPGVLTDWAMYDRVKNIPDPIVEPTASIVASNSPKRRCNWRVWLMVSAPAFGLVDEGR